MKTTHKAEELKGMKWGEGFRYEGESYTFLYVLRWLPTGKAVVQVGSPLTDGSMQINVYP